jgi:endonuclease-3
MRTVPAALPGGLHRDAAGARRQALDGGGCERRQTAWRKTQSTHPARGRATNAHRRGRARGAALGGCRGAGASARAARREVRSEIVNPAKRNAIFTRLRELNPHPTTELRHSTPYQLLVAVVLSAQATDKSVNAATQHLFQVASKPRSMVELGVDGLEKHIRSIGLFRTKAKHIIGLSRILLAQHGGEVPATREALEQLPGVGRKTANVVLNTAFGQPTIAVDTHIFRVANRTGLAPGKTPLEVERKLVKSTPAEFAQDAHHWLILHGRYVCLARKPRCPECVIREWCAFKPKTRASEQGNQDSPVTPSRSEQGNQGSPVTPSRSEQGNQGSPVTPS